MSGSEREDGRIFRNLRHPVLTADINLYCNDRGAVRLKGEDTGNHLPERQRLIHDN
jgi:hypothetical protein